LQGVGAGNLLKQENEEKKEKGISQDIIHIGEVSVHFFIFQVFNLTLFDIL